MVAQHAAAYVPAVDSMAQRAEADSTYTLCALNWKLNGNITAHGFNVPTQHSPGA
jgi:hypothetical protein